MSETLSFAPAVATFFIENLHPKIVITKRNKITNDGKTYFHGSSDIYRKLVKLLDLEHKRKLIDNWGSNHLDFEEVSFGVALEAEIIKQLAGTVEDHTPKKAAAEVFKGAFFNEEFDTPFSELKLMLNLREKKKSFLYDEVNDKAHRYDYEIIKDRVRDVLGDAKDQWLQTNTVDCMPEYRPLQARVFKDHNKACTIFNLWEQAPWCVNWMKNTHAKCPIEIKDFFDAFFSDEDSRHFAQAWLRDATFGRAEPIIVLCGIPGIGKNIFVESLLANLVGPLNYRSASRGFNRSQFHSGITSCRAFFLDEMNLTPEARDNLKAYHNGRSTIERKGVDAGDPEEIFASIAIANNFPEKVQLEYRDRKFFTPNLTKVPILSTLGQTKIDKLVRLMKDVDYLREFASYLFFNFEQGSSAKFKKNAFFKQLCINSYNTRFRRFINLCHKCERFSSRDFNHGYRAHYDVFALTDLLNHYEVQFEEKLADLTIDISGKWVAESRVYTGPKSDDPALNKPNLVLI